MEMEFEQGNGTRGERYLKLTSDSAIYCISHIKSSEVPMPDFMMVFDDGLVRPMNKREFVQAMDVAQQNGVDKKIVSDLYTFFEIAEKNNHVSFAETKGSGKYLTMYKDEMYYSLSADEKYPSIVVNNNKAYSMTIEQMTDVLDAAKKCYTPEVLAKYNVGAYEDRIARQSRQEVTRYKKSTAEILWENANIANLSR